MVAEEGSVGKGVSSSMGEGIIHQARTVKMVVLDGGFAGRGTGCRWPYIDSDGG